MPLCRLLSGRCPLPDAAEAVSIGESVPPDPHVPSSWFFPTSTVYSTCQPAGLLHPAADSGVHFVGVRVPKCLHPAKVSPAPACFRCHHRIRPPRPFPLCSHPAEARWAHPAVPISVLAEHGVRTRLGSSLPMSFLPSCPCRLHTFRSPPTVDLGDLRQSQSVAPDVEFPLR